MAQTTNPRKTVANHVLTRTLESLPEGFEVRPDPTNPYAFQVLADGKCFRVIVKEQG